MKGNFRVCGIIAKGFKRTFTKILNSYEFSLKEHNFKWHKNIHNIFNHQILYKLDDV